MSDESCAQKLFRVSLAFILHGSYCIAAIYIGYTETCNNNGYEIIVAPNMYLLIGGFVGIVDGLCISNWTFDLTQFNPAQATAHCCGAIWHITWTVIGSILFTQLTWECQQSTVGLMLLAWIIINWVYIGCRFVFIIAGFFVSEHSTFKTMNQRNIMPDYMDQHQLDDDQIEYL